MGPSLTSRGPADRAALVVRDLGDLVDLGRAGLVVTGRAGQADPVGLVDLGRAGLVVTGRAGRVALGRVGLVVMGRAGRVDLDPVGLVVLDLAGLGDPVVLDPVDRVDIRGLADRADPAVLDLAGPVGLGDQGMDPGGLVDPAGLDPAGLDPAGREDLGDQGMDPAGRVDLVDRVDLVVPVGRTHPGVRTSGVAPRWAAPGMRRTASAHPTTVRRLHPDNTASAGMVGLLPERRRRSGTGRRPRVAGAVRRLPVVGTAHGMVRRVTGASRSVISGRSITTVTTRSRCLTRSLGDGASGSSVSGSRCTDTT